MKKKREIKVNVITINQPSKSALSEFTNEFIRLYNGRTLVKEQQQEQAS